MAKKQPGAKRTNSYDPVLREIIAWRICEARQKAYPDRGGLTECARAFGMSPQQWAQYEGGHRSPEDQHLERIAKHLKTTVHTLMTPPANWTSVKEEWRASRTRGRRKTPADDRQNTTAEQTLASPATAANHALPANPAHGALPLPSTSHDTRILEVIHKMLNVDALRAEGKISTDDFTNTLRSVEVLVDALRREHIR